MPGRHGSRSRLLQGVVVALLCALALAGCAGGGSKSGSGADGEPAGDSSDSATPSPPRKLATFGIPTVGECHQVTPVQNAAAVDTSPAVPCTGPHNARVLLASVTPTALAPEAPAAARITQAAGACTVAFNKTVGGNPAARAMSLFDWVVHTPSAEQIARGARWLRCDVVARSGDALVALPARAPFLGGTIPPAYRICQTRNFSDVSCAGPHAYRLQGVFRAPGQAYPAGQDFLRLARDKCFALSGKYGSLWQPPSREGWNAGDRFVRCLEPR